jgi:hypothetical protein
MSEETEGCAAACSRRLLFQGAVGAIGAAAAAAAVLEAAFATIKISKAAVAYQDHPDGDKRCGKCRQFVSPDSCKLVDGEISAQGFCRLFAPLSTT